MKTQLSKIIFFSVATFFTFLPNFSFGAIKPGTSVITSAGGGQIGGGQYQPITPAGFFKGNENFEGMLTTLFNLSVTFTIMLAVVMMIVGGIQYMGSESVFAKGAGKDKIFAALGGLLIVLASVLIIGTILPGGNGSEIKIVIFGGK